MGRVSHAEGWEPPTEGEVSFDPTADAEEDSSSTPADNFERFDCTSDDAGVLAAATEAARLAVESGQCIVLPTDTVYGIGADAFSPEAVQRLLDAKHRGRDMPPPVLIADPTLLRVLAIDVPQTAKDLVSRHWPGPLTVICHAQPSLRMDLGDADGTIALRVPDHELARDVLRQTGPMAVSSANVSGQRAAVSCEEAIDQLGDEVAVYLDAGRLTSADSAPSTIVDFTQHDTGEVLRHGALSLAVLRETLPDLKDLVETGEDATEPAESEPAEPAPAESEPAEPAPAESEPAEPASADFAPADPAPVETERVETDPRVAGPGGSHVINHHDALHPPDDRGPAGA
jgi:tRNA threonylcarbamoyl adenosine modification protein (Sua5/YciO/YrdC/YwlC family)